MLAFETIGTPTTYTGFDLELMSSFPEGVDHDTLFDSDLQVAAAALCKDDRASVFCKGDYSPIDESTVEKICQSMDRLRSRGEYVVTWNGAAFDFRVLATVAPSLKSRLATHMLDHIDLMLIVVATRGHLLGLQAAAAGAGLSKKLNVKLKSGAQAPINGHLTPDLWKAGEVDAVIDYLVQDCEITSRLAAHVYKTKAIRWLSKSNRDMTAKLRSYDDDSRLPTVRELYKDKRRHKINTSWMTDPPSLDKMIAWALDEPVNQASLL